MGDVRVTRVGTQAVVRLSGEVGAALGPALAAARGEVVALRPTRVAVDLDAVTGLDAAGLAFLDAVRRDCGERGLPLRFVEVPAEVRPLLRR